MPLQESAIPLATIDIRASIEKALAEAVPDGKRGAVVAITNADGVHFTVAAKISDQWQLAATAEHLWSGQNGFTVSLYGSF